MMMKDARNEFVSFVNNVLEEDPETAVMIINKYDRLAGGGEGKPIVKVRYKDGKFMPARNFPKKVCDCGYEERATELEMIGKRCPYCGKRLKEEEEENHGKSDC